MGFLTLFALQSIKMKIPGTESLGSCSFFVYHRPGCNSYLQGACPRPEVYFQVFIQERVAMTRRTIEKNGVEGLNDWRKIYLYDWCRNSKKDFLYGKELHGRPCDEDYVLA